MIRQRDVNLTADVNDDFTTFSPPRSLARALAAAVGLRKN
jgi:hypothetical protein